MQRGDADQLPSAFSRHRLALAPARAEASAKTLEEAFALAAATGEQAFVAFLLQNGLGPVWRHAIDVHGIEGRLSPGSLQQLDWSRRSAAASYLMQQETLQRIDQLFEARGIAYAAIKGAHVRELVYSDPYLRPSCDIDLLVAPPQRASAARALTDLGFAYLREPGTISHQAVFTGAAVNIDLHWDILRPGRTRIDVAEAFIARRRRLGWFWGPEETDALFLMLTHPVFAKYVCTPHMTLCRVMDFIQWTKGRPSDLARVVELLDETGLKTAAWSMLTWFSMLGVDIPDLLMTKVQPGPARARYLRYWLERDLPTRWLESRPLLVQFGLSLFLHDRLSDAGVALVGRARARLHRLRDERELTRPADEFADSPSCSLLGRER